MSSIMFAVMSAIAPNAWWTGVPTKLVRKTTMVEPIEAEADQNAIDGRLPVYTLTFEIPTGIVSEGKAQPIENTRVDMGDVVKIVIPGYKPKSYSMSAIRLDDKEFDITIKVYPNGRASGTLDRLQIGDTINSFGMRVNRIRNEGKCFVGIAYGVGITEILPVAQAECEKGDAEKVLVLWAGRTSNDTFWHDRIEQMERQYGKEKFEIVYIFSREKKKEKETEQEDTEKEEEKEKEAKNVWHGRLNPSLLKEILESRITNKENNTIKGEDVRFLAIGTKSMITLTERWLTQIGYPMPKHCLLPKKQMF